MKRAVLIALVMILLTALVFSPFTGAVVYKRASNKIYTSILDKDLVVIAPNDNDTLGYHSTYQFYLVETNIKNFTVWYNYTRPIAFKDNHERAIISSFYVNDTAFTISVTEGNNNATHLIIIHYIAKGGFVPWPEPTPIPEPEPDDHNQTAGIFAGYTKSEITALAGAVIFLICFVTVLIGFTVKRVKEHHTDEESLGTGATYYRRRETSADAKIWAGDEK